MLQKVNAVGSKWDARTEGRAQENPLGCRKNIFIVPFIDKIKNILKIVFVSSLSHSLSMIVFLIGFILYRMLLQHSYML